MRSVLKIENFGVDKRWLDFHGKTIPAEDFIPHDISESLIFVFAFSFSGLLLQFMTMPWIGTVFCGLCFAAMVLFAKKHIALNIYLTAKDEKLPKNRPDIGDRGVCCEKIYGGSYGRITFSYKGHDYKINALSANETDIETGEEVIVVHKEEEVCWVERTDEEMAAIEDE